MPHATGPSFQIDFDFLRHAVVATTVDGTSRSLDLTEAPPVAEFHARLLATLDDLGVGTDNWPMPVEIPGAIRFDEDYEHASYDPDSVWRFWRSLVATEPVFKRFRSHFVGKSSPVHFFWGALDLASTRFSGRDAPPHPGRAPNCGPHVMWEAYSQEVSSAGYWPGPPGEEGIFYSYAYPDPPGFRDHPVGPDAARWDDELTEFVLPYEAVRTAQDPDAILLEFLQSTYEAAAITASWDRGTLERDPGAPVTSAARIVDGTVPPDAASSTPGVVAGPEADESGRAPGQMRRNLIHNASRVLPPLEALIAGAQARWSTASSPMRATGLAIRNAVGRRPAIDLGAPGTGDGVVVVVLETANLGARGRKSDAYSEARPWSGFQRSNPRDGERPSDPSPS